LRSPSFVLTFILVAIAIAMHFCCSTSSNEFLKDQIYFPFFLSECPRSFIKKDLNETVPNLFSFQDQCWFFLKDASWDAVLINNFLLPFPLEQIIYLQAIGVNKVFFLLQINRSNCWYQIVPFWNFYGVLSLKSMRPFFCSLIMTATHHQVLLTLGFMCASKLNDFHIENLFSFSSS